MGSDERIFSETAEMKTLDSLPNPASGRAPISGLNPD
jgi:hypothetical protein